MLPYCVKKVCEVSYLNSVVVFFSSSVGFLYKSTYDTVREQYLKVLSTKVRTNFHAARGTCSTIQI